MITTNMIFYPVLTLVLFTFLIGFGLAKLRIQALLTKRVKPNQLRDPARWDEVFASSENFSDAFENLFEMPVLFYALVPLLIVSGRVDLGYVVGAWAFVLFRVVQGAIHCTSNQIRHRATAFWFGAFTLFALWVRFAVQSLM